MPPVRSVAPLSTPPELTTNWPLALTLATLAPDKVTNVPPVEITVACAIPPALTVSTPPAAMKAAISVPPELTKRPPPLASRTAEPTPPWMERLAPLPMVAPMAKPPEETISTPPDDRPAARSVPPERTMSRPLMLAPLTMPSSKSVAPLASMPPIAVAPDRTVWVPPPATAIAQSTAPLLSVSWPPLPILPALVVPATKIWAPEPTEPPESVAPETTNSAAPLDNVTPDSVPPA